MRRRRIHSRRVGGLAARHQRQAQLFGLSQFVHPAQRILERARRGIVEHRVVQRIEPVVQLARLLEIVRGARGLEIGAKARRDIGRDGRCTPLRPAALAGSASSSSPEAGRTALTDAHAVIGHAAKVAARILDADDPLRTAPRQFAHRLGRISVTVRPGTL